MSVWLWTIQWVPLSGQNAWCPGSRTPCRSASVYTSHQSWKSTSRNTWTLEKSKICRLVMHIKKWNKVQWLCKSPTVLRHSSRCDATKSDGPGGSPKSSGQYKICTSTELVCHMLQFELIISVNKKEMDQELSLF